MKIEINDDNYQVIKELLPQATAKLTAQSRNSSEEVLKNSMTILWYAQSKAKEGYSSICAMFAENVDDSDLIAKEISEHFPSKDLAPILFVPMPLNIIGGVECFISGLGYYAFCNRRSRYMIIDWESFVPLFSSSSDS